ncbi:bifunctional UDP-N-acetylglucosamine pyrophosphorylase / Glucosamine-1-phosphate N-acetyltransferase [Armatimonadetes bacterium GBS]|jgi:bifunctional UDP-N-acetylglucosamine pyrophosphorylase/glucosamine-1-phosphate N-acetyltransferase|nr:bifunctional UDP-N-acetylglucosamine pyrophosphorylase / Glucosamine-1-phosphate N-acetyltransferase [Armatimonadetes bacterium GBS]CUU38019.1 bifunctional UDP-N-acetylglucosamine pyrophosphorylase / Glucosamine-1-phosphate N-acetyltransferase [Armatimonadetes bacterium GXS]
MAESRKIAGIVLAAGKGTRMKSDTPKALMPLLGLPLTAHVLRAMETAGIEPIVVVIGHRAEEVRAALGERYRYALQAEQLGTGHACLQALPELPPEVQTVVVAPGDSPLITHEAFQAMLTLHQNTQADATLATAVLEDPTGYGRILRDGHGRVVGIVEEKDASPEQKAIREVCTSFYCFEVSVLREMLPRLSNQNAQGEYYLTDVIGIIAQAGGKVATWQSPDPALLMGVNNRWELAQAAQALRMRILKHLALEGVTIVDPATTYIEPTVEVGHDTVIEPNTHLKGATRIGSRCTLGPDLVLQDTQVGDECHLFRSHIVGAQIESGVSVGPFAHIRPGTVLKQGVRVGDFVEIKNTQVGEGTKVLHLTYLGDAIVGQECNIGAGTITCNYDGQRKHQTVIGNRVFVGSHATLIAPVTIHDDAYIAAASPITDDVPSEALAIARCRQTNREGWVRRKRESINAQGKEGATNE